MAEVLCEMCGLRCSSAEDLEIHQQRHRDRSEQLAGLPRAKAFEVAHGRPPITLAELESFQLDPDLPRWQGAADWVYPRHPLRRQWSPPTLAADAMVVDGVSDSAQPPDDES